MIHVANPATQPYQDSQSWFGTLSPYRMVKITILPLTLLDDAQYEQMPCEPPAPAGSVCAPKRYIGVRGLVRVRVRASRRFYLGLVLELHRLY